jgi:L-fuculose-phosphate aldolase
MLLKNEREAVVRFGKKLISAGLVKGSGGNISLSDHSRKLIAISPSGVEYDQTKPNDVVVIDLSGKIVDGKLKPSSELPFHLGLYNLREDIHAVVHTHSVFATTIACLGWEIPALHYLIGFAGLNVPCAPYATFGTEELSENISRTIGTGNALLLANHGVIAVGPSLNKAFETAELIEYVAQLYFQAKSIGSPKILSDTQMVEVLNKFMTYGQPTADQNNEHS